MSVDVVDASHAPKPLSISVLGTGWRIPVAAAAIITAAAHIPVTGEHLHEALYIGVLFVLLEVASAGLAIAILLRPSSAIYATSSFVGALAVLALVVSRTVGLPLIGDDVGNWTEPLALVSVAAELLMTVGGLLAATSAGRSRSSARAGVVVGLTVLMLGLAATVFATIVEDGASDDGPATSGSTGMAGMDMGLPAHAAQR